MWSGRFRQPLDAEFEKWQRSFPYDQRLLPFELSGQPRPRHRARTRRSSLIRRAFRNRESSRRNRRPRQSPSPDFLNDPEAEDVHHFVEKQLTVLIGATGYKLHTGRSRNEQIATDLRLFVRQSIDTLQTLIADWIDALLTRAEAAGNAAMPAYTHLQPAEPVLVAHWLLAYVEMFLRDAARLADCRKRANLAPWDRARWPERRSRSIVRLWPLSSVSTPQPRIASTLRAIVISHSNSSMRCR